CLTHAGLGSAVGSVLGVIAGVVNLVIQGPILFGFIIPIWWGFCGSVVGGVAGGIAGAVWPRREEGWMAGESRSVRGRLRPLAIAGGYLAIAWGCVLYAWLDPGTYSLNFLLPVLATAPTSLLGIGVINILDLQGSPGLAAAMLAACGLIQAAA